MLRLAIALLIGLALGYGLGRFTTPRPLGAAWTETDDGALAPPEPTLARGPAQPTPPSLADAAPARPSATPTASNPEDLSARIRDGDLADAMGWIKARSTFSAPEIEALLEQARTARAKRHKRAFLELAGALARSRHPEAVDWLLGLARGEDGRNPAGFHDLLLQSWMKAEEIDLTSLVRKWVGLEGPVRPGTNHYSCVQYLLDRGTEEDRTALLAHEQEWTAAMTWMALMHREPSRAPDLYAAAVASDRLGSRRPQLLSALASTGTGAALDILEAHVRDVDSDKNAPHGLTTDTLLYYYLGGLRPGTYARGAAFLEGLDSELLRILAARQLPQLFESGHSLHAFARLARQPAQTIRRVLTSKDVSADDEALFRFATETVFEKPPLLNEDNVAALEEAAAQRNVGDQRALQNKATHYRAKLEARYWR